MSRSITIGVLSPVTGGLYYGKILAGIAREVAAVGGRVVLIQTLDAGLSSDEIASAPDFTTPTAWDHLDGVISIASATQRSYLDRLRAAGKAVSLASTELAGFDAPSATPDNASGVTDSVHHLVEHGHTRIGYAANLVQTDMMARHDAYRAAMLAHGLEADPKWFFAAYDNGELGGRDVARQLVAAGMPVTALVLATDRNAIGCMEQLADFGLSAPGDLAVIGFDGLDAGIYTKPTLSTVLQPYDEIGASAARLVLAQLRGENVEARAYASPSRFLPRESCGCGIEELLLDTDHGLGFWRDEAKMRFARGAHRERSMSEQYDIGMQLLDHARMDPKRLAWLGVTGVRGAYLALWDGDPSMGVLRIAGGHDPHDLLPDLVGTVCRLEQFPPVSLLEAADPQANEVTIVVPLKARGLDYGFLAVAGEVDAMSANGREAHNQWAASLTAALEQQDLVENVRASEERYSLYARATNDGLWDWDLTADTFYLSGRCMELFGHPYETASSGPSVWFDAVHPDELERVRQMLDMAVTGAEAVFFEHRVRMPDGSYHRVACRVLPVGQPGRAVARLVGSIHDIEPRKQLEEQLRQGAFYDEVTGLPNRKLFLERLSSAIADWGVAPQSRYAVVFLDLDGFKLVNDSLGHLAGDHLLVQVGERIRSGLRPTDLAARFGGDEFAVLLLDVGLAATQVIVQRMQAGLAAPMYLDGQEVVVTASIGITTSDGAYANAEDVLRDADIAMYFAKSHTRGSFVVFDVSMHATAVARLGLQSEVRQAIDRNQLEIYYQPIVRLDADGTDHFEALVRWHHPVLGLVKPVDFLPDVEQAGLTVTLGRWIVEEVCRQIARWQESYGAKVKVSVNLSHGEFSDVGLLPHILKCLSRYALTPANLTLEIPEGLIMRRPDVARAIIEELHAAGIGVQIDDFGTGTSSLHALHRLPVRALKIDRSLIHDLGADQRTTKLVQIIVAMGEALGVEVVAEGVETAAQYELLRQMGCRNAQGFWFTEAVDATSAAAFLGQSIPARSPDALGP
ncbi:MAG TPA: EAL domain-containing protein [Ilumatobacteraceae bacterium]|nr:EAL domain-containing protein [Ilumatobacteraceae bacterium]